MEKSNDKKRSKEKKEKDNMISELIKSNTYLYKYCNLLKSEIAVNSLDINQIYNQLIFSQKKLNETQILIEMLIMKNGIDPSSLEEIKKQLNIKQPNKLDQTVSTKETKFLLHDNLTERCKNCNSIGNKEDVTCKECGFKK